MTPIFKDRSKDFDNSSGDIAEDIVKSTMQMYQTDRKKFNKEVRMAHFDSDSDEEEKLYRAKKSAKKNASKKNKYLSDDDDDDDILMASSKKSSRRSSKYDLSDDVKSSRKKSILKYPDDDEDEDEEELLETARRRGKEIGFYILTYNHVVGSLGHVATITKGANALRLDTLI